MRRFITTIKRWQEEKIKEALKSRRVVILSGSRQCGKTTTFKKLVSKDSIYRTLDDINLYHYRDREKRETNFILENDTKIFGVEAKSGSSVNEKMFKHLTWFKKQFS